MKKSKGKTRRAGHKPRKSAKSPSPARNAAPRHIPSGERDLAAKLVKAAKLIDDGRSHDALAILNPLTVQHPGDADLWALKGRAHTTIKGQMGEACAALQKASDLDPKNVERLLALGTAHRFAGHHLLACRAFLEAQRLEPKNLQAVGNLALMFNQLGDAATALEVYRPLIDSDEETYSNYLMIMNYIDHLDARAVADATAQWARKFESRITPMSPAQIAPAAGRRLRVGYLSSDFREHSVMRFLLPLFDHHDRTCFEITCYYTGLVEREDAITRQVEARVDTFRRVRSLSDADLAKRIRADKIDVLVDLNGHTGGHRLGVMARRPAPVQATWLGYPNTTGLSAVDYRVSDVVVDPEGMFDDLSSEHIVRMAGGFHCFRSIPETPEVAPLPAEKTGRITFGAYNNLSKVTPTTLDLWAKVMKAVPDANLLVKANVLIDPHVCTRLRGEFEARGIASNRMLFTGWLADVQAHLRTYGKIDIALDPYPYNGTTTTCEALWMGVPTITLCGETPASRVSASLLTQVGLEPLVAHDPETFVLNAVELAGDIDRLAALRGQMRQAMAESTLGDEPGFARRFEDMLRRIYAEKTGDRPDPAPAERPVPPVAAAAKAPASDGRPSTPSTEIRVLHHLARTGGTLISKCLGSMAGVTLLSEAHPKGMTIIDPVKQAQQWFGLIDADQARAISRDPDGFAELIALAADQAAARGDRLVIRDWTHLDYTGVPFATPTYRLTTAEMLGARFDRVIATATVRHPIDQWLSLNRLAVTHGKLSIADYLYGYRRFAEEARGIGFVRYEDFTHAPDDTLGVLCQRLDLSFDPGYRQRWQRYDRITGDVSKADAPREIRAVRPRTPEPELLRAFEASPDYRPALDLLGYQPAEALPAGAEA